MVAGEMQKSFHERNAKFELPNNFTVIKNKNCAAITKQRIFMIILLSNVAFQKVSVWKLKNEMKTDVKRKRRG